MRRNESTNGFKLRLKAQAGAYVLLLGPQMEGTWVEVLGEAA